MPTEPNPPPLTLTGLASAMVRAWRVLVAGAGAGLVVGLATWWAVPPHYEAVATVRVDPVETISTSPPTELDMTAEQGVAGSRRVSTVARELIGARRADVEQIEAGVSVRAVDDSRVLRVRSAATSADDAADRANAVASAYLATRSADAMQAADRVRRRAERELPVADRAARARLEATLTRLDLADLRGGVVIDPARPPRSPSGPGPAVSGLAGLVLGTLLAAPVAARPLSRSRAAHAS